MAENRAIVGHMQAHLPHRCPFLFVEEGEISADGNVAWGRHTFRPDEPYFAGHFPGNPIVPGVILLELVAQTANLLMSHRAGQMIHGYLVGVAEATFNVPVHPNQTVVAEVRLAREPSSANGDGAAGRIITFKAAAYSEERRCMRAVVNIYQSA